MRTGIANWLAGRARGGKPLRVVLLSHAAAVDEAGVSTLDRLAAEERVRVTAVLAPEHGYWGLAGAGDAVADTVHRRHGIPVRSLYGALRKPTASMLAGADCLLIDLQDLGVRCYTYVATLHHALEAAAGQGLPVVVADRPIPLPEATDGPRLDPGLAGFVACADVPLCYGMTPAETARWLCRHAGIAADLRAEPMTGYAREARRGAGWPAWHPPSPGIRSWASAETYAATVFTEALPSLSCDRGGPMAFRVLGAPWVDGERMVDALNGRGLPGVSFHDHRWATAGGTASGARMAVTDPVSFRPVRTGVAMLAVLRDLHGDRAVWGAPGTRDDAFDRLAGSSSVREALRAGAAFEEAAAAWEPGLQAFAAERDACLLYRRGG